MVITVYLAGFFMWENVGEIFIRRSKRCRLLWGWLNYEVEVHLPVVPMTIVSVALDLPCTRIAGRFSVTTADTDIDILECHVP